MPVVMGPGLAESQVAECKGGWKKPKDGWEAAGGEAVKEIVSKTQFLWSGPSVGGRACWWAGGWEAAAPGRESRQNAALILSTGSFLTLLEAAKSEMKAPAWVRI